MQNKAINSVNETCSSLRASHQQRQGGWKKAFRLHLMLEINLKMMVM